MDLFNNMLVSSMDRSLDGLWKRQEVISDNIANFETPGYKRKYVTFENELKNAMDSKNVTKDEKVSRINNSEISVNKDETRVMREDGNSVDIEQENIEMLRTSYQYMYAERVMKDHFSRLRTAISEGRK